MADRHRFRADWHDYNEGIYFVTICCANKQHLFGKIVYDPAVGTRFIASAANPSSPVSSCTRFIASALGSIVENDINNLTTYHDDLELINFVVMPNHVHIVLAINPSQSEGPSSPSNMGCLKPPRHGEPVDDFHHNSRLATIIGAFKAGVTRKARTRKIASLPEDVKIWQERYHEHLIRNQHAFDNIMNYIDTNVEKWGYDCFNTDL